MDKQWDDLSKSLVKEGISRREVLRRCGVGLASVLLAPTALEGIARAGTTSTTNREYLLVSSFNTNSILRYDATTGAYVDAIVRPQSGGLRQPGGVIFGPDHNLYVASGWEWDNGVGHQYILRYNGTSGAFIDTFADENQTTSSRAILFGPDGNLYVADGNPRKPSRGVLRYNGATGAFIDTFVAPGSGGVDDPNAMVFGPDGNLYVGDIFNNRVMRYDGTTGAFQGVFAGPGNGLNVVMGIVFGPDGNLYVASLGDYFSAGATPGSVSRFQGPGGANPGAFIDTFIPGGSGGLCNPVGLLFGPDGNLYVTSVVGFHSYQSGVRQFGAVPGTSQVLRYDGVTGAFLDVFVTPDSGGLQLPVFMTFTRTDPATLNYNP
jgi:sugar lactone lactonase YvrE